MCERMNTTIFGRLSIWYILLLSLTTCVGYAPNLMNEISHIDNAMA
jgi:hypothetical protein